MSNPLAPMSVQNKIDFLLFWNFSMFFKRFCCCNFECNKEIEGNSWEK